MHEAGQRSRETTKLLIDLSFVCHDHARIRAVSTEDAELLSMEDQEATRLALVQT